MQDKERRLRFAREFDFFFPYANAWALIQKLQKSTNTKCRQWNEKSETGEISEIQSAMKQLISRPKEAQIKSVRQSGSRGINGEKFDRAR